MAICTISTARIPFGAILLLLCFTCAPVFAVSLTITDGERVQITDRITEPKVLRIQFAGRIEPHENSVVVLGESTDSPIDKEFDQIILPEGWLCDTKYNAGA